MISRYDALGKVKKFIPLVLMSLIPTILIWLPFFLRVEKFWNIPLPQNGMATVVSNYDGPLYLVAAKTFYNSQLIGANYQFPLSYEYYSAHFPMFPLLIKAFAGILGHPYSMLFVTLLSSILALYFFKKHADRLLKPTDALWLTFIFAIFPARWLIVRSVGSPEPFFVASILASTYFFGQKRYWLAGLWGMLAQMTKSPAILLFIAYVIELGIPYLRDITKIEIKKYLGILLIPFGLLAVFTTYGIVYNDFFVYFKSGDNIHLFFPPFQIFDYSAPWVGTFWLEEIIFIYTIGILGVYKLYEQKLKTYFCFSLIFGTSLLFVAHRDILRYALPIVPFLIIAFRDLLIKREFKIVISVIIIPIYLYSLAFISQNTMPISNWQPFL